MARPPRGFGEVVGAASGRASWSPGGFADYLEEGLSGRGGALSLSCGVERPLPAGGAVSSGPAETRAPRGGGRGPPRPCRRSAGVGGSGATTAPVSVGEAVSPAFRWAGSRFSRPPGHDPPGPCGGVSVCGCGVSPDLRYCLLPGPADVQPFWVLNVSSHLAFDGGRGGLRVHPYCLFFFKH